MKLSQSLALVGLSALLSLPLSNACTPDGVEGIMAENDMYIAVEDKSANDMTKIQFDKLLDTIEAIYSPIIAKRGKKLEIIRKWDDGTVNAYAQQVGNKWKVSMFGGLARHEAITVDGFALVACHELGHHIGGLPKKKTWFSSNWATNEGQSDYFGTSKCLRKYMEGDDNIAMVSNMNIPQAAHDKCEANFSNAEDIAICLRGAMAGHALGSVFKGLKKLSRDLKFTTPDTNVVRKTFHGHPAPQCRLDTYFAGAICEIDAYTDVSDRDVNQGVCNRRDGHEDGIRSLCWFKPKN